jgi:hypothetical protein
MDHHLGVDVMIRYTMIFFIMVILFLGGVIIGFDQAGSGMNELRGNNETSFDALEVSKNDDQYEVEVFGQTLEKESLQEKKESYDDINGDFFLEKLAVTVEKSVQWFYNLLIDGAYQITELFYRI